MQDIHFLSLLHLSWTFSHYVVLQPGMEIDLWLYQHIMNLYNIANNIEVGNQYSLHSYLQISYFSIKELSKQLQDNGVVM